jgi:nitroreductase
MVAMQAIAKRWCIRKYRPEPVTDEDLQTGSDTVGSAMGK